MPTSVAAAANLVAARFSGRGVVSAAVANNGLAMNRRAQRYDSMPSREAWSNCRECRLGA